MTAILAALIPYLMPVITGLLAWAATAIAKASAASAAEKKAVLAGLKVGAIATSLLQKGWEHIGPEVQAALADGKIDSAERAIIETSVKELLADATDAATLEEIGKALGLPLAGVVAKIAAFLIEKWAAAHDPNVPTASSLAYPTPAMIEAPAITLNQGSAPDPTGA